MTNIITSATRFLSQWNTAAPETDVNLYSPDDLVEYIAHSSFLGATVLNVMDPQFAGGARGDGVADDTAAFASALAAITAAGGGVLFLPGGRRFLVQPGVLTYTANTVIAGVGVGSVVVLKTGSATAERTVFAPASTDVTGFAICDVLVDQRGDTYGNNGSSPAISVNSTIGASVERVTFQNVQTMAVWCDSTVAHPTARLMVLNNRIINSYGGGFSFFGEIHGISVCTNRIEATDDDAIALQDSVNGQPQFFVVAQNIILNCNRRLAGTTPGGVLAYGATRGTITGNTIDTTCASSIRVQQGASFRASHVVVSENMCSKAGITPDSIAGVPTHGVYVLNADDVTVTGNTLRENHANGVYATLSTQLTITGNTATLNGSSGFNIEACVDFTLMGNTAMDNGTTGTGADVVGILLISDSGAAKNDRGLISNNRCGDDRAGGARTQTYGIYGAGGTNGGTLSIANNEVETNVTAGIGGSFSTTTRIRANTGYNPVGTVNIGAAGASPYTYTAGNSPLNLSVIGGTVSAVSKNGVNVATATNAIVHLEPGESVIVTYTVAPTLIVDTE